jgi:general secretion pathway protein G
MVVIVVLTILVALLLPAINGAIRAAKNAAVSSEISQLASALASFKAKYGDYPPSRVYLAENGDYSVVGSTVPVPGSPYAKGAGDITLGALATRTVRAFRQFFPRVILSTSGPVFTGNPPKAWYDFNGNGVMDGPYILSGHECLVFFLGGVPVPDQLTSTPRKFGMTGFGTDPTNPFSNSIAGNTMFNANRQPPFFEFNPGRLFLDPSNQTDPQNPNGTNNPGIPGYYDSLSNQPPGNVLTLNFYAYFSAYGSGSYDPNDVNFPELDDTTGLPIELQYQVGFPTLGAGGTVAATGPYFATSESPNPYTSTLTANHPAGALPTGIVTYQNPQTFQIISSGQDGLYGVGGQYQPSATGAEAVSVPVNASNLVNTTNAGIRQREFDNLTNFKNGTLQ